jgi:hypothetical protein
MQNSKKNPKGFDNNIAAINFVSPNYPMNPYNSRSNNIDITHPQDTHIGEKIMTNTLCKIDKINCPKDTECNKCFCLNQNGRKNVIVLAKVNVMNQI